MVLITNKYLKYLQNHVKANSIVAIFALCYVIEYALTILNVS